MSDDSGSDTPTIRMAGDDKHPAAQECPLSLNRPSLKRNLLWRIMQPPVALFCRLWLRIDSLGLENIDPGQGGLFLINHQSYLDPVLVAVLLDRPISFLARDSLFKVPLLGWLLRRTYVIPISREAVRAGSIRDAVTRLDEGFLVGIFPEGTRSSGDTVRTFRPGFLALVRRTGQPVYPVAIAGADRVMPRGAWFIRPRSVRVIYGQAMTADELQQLHHGTDERQLSEIARSKVAHCHSQALALLNRQP
jgi:1-acyl-sn-glycerol-3-phosphate acyltransferase